MIHLCPECKAQVSAAAYQCPQCGHPFEQNQGSSHNEVSSARQTPVLWIIAALTGLVGVVGIIAFIFVSNKPAPVASVAPSVFESPKVSENELKAKQMELEIERLKLEQSKIKNQPAQAPAVTLPAPAVHVTDTELRDLDCRSLWILRNTIYARYGRVFSDPQVRSYFLQQAWYRPSSGYHDGLLSQSEKASAASILAVEKQGGCM